MKEYTLGKENVWFKKTIFQQTQKLDSFISLSSIQASLLGTAIKGLKRISPSRSMKTWN